MKQDDRFKSIQPSLFKPWIWREWLSISKRNHQVLPSPLWLVSQQFGYLVPWYDPVHEAKTEDAIAYLDQSPAAKRAMLKVAWSPKNKKAAQSAAFFILEQGLRRVR